MSTVPNPLSIAVLALLNERPMHPYEMYQLLLDRHEDRLVKVRPGSLYHVVERLEGRGLVEATGTERAGNRPERTTYAITKVGRTTLVGWVDEMITEPINEYPIFPVALSESHNLPQDQALAALGARIDRIDKLVAELDDVIAYARESDVPEGHWFAADYVRAMHIAERDWLRTTVARIEQGELAWPQAK